MNSKRFVAWMIIVVMALQMAPSMNAAARSRSSARPAKEVDNVAPRGFTSLFNGRDFTGWKVPQGDGGHWKIIDGVIDYDAQSQATGDKNLWSVPKFGDFILRVDWRIKETPYVNPRVPYVLPDGTPRTQADKPVGQWNRFEITMRGDRVTVVLNGKTVIKNAQLPGIAATGPIALQHHGGKRDGKWVSPPSLLQFKNIFIKKL